MKRILVVLLVLMLAGSSVACGGEKETTVTGMITAVDGSVISIMEMDSPMSGGKNFSNGQRPSRDEGFAGNFPQWGDGEMPTRPENGEMPEGFDGSFPQWGEGEMPTDENGEMQWPGVGEGGGMKPGFGNFNFEGETTQIDIGNAHISVEIDGGKAGGSLEDITPGSFVTITRNSKGEVTNVLVSSRSGFGGMGGFGGRGKKPTENSET